MSPIKNCTESPSILVASPILWSNYLHSFTLILSNYSYGSNETPSWSSKKLYLERIYFLFSWLMMLLMLVGRGSYLVKTFNADENLFFSFISILTKWMKVFGWVIKGKALLNSISDKSLIFPPFKLFKIKSLCFFYSLSTLSKLLYRMYTDYFRATSTWTIPSIFNLFSLAKDYNFLADFSLFTNQIILAKGIKDFQVFTAPSSISYSSQKFDSFRIKSIERTMVVYFIFLTLLKIFRFECFHKSLFRSFIYSITWFSLCSGNFKLKKFFYVILNWSFLTLGICVLFCF